MVKVRVIVGPATGRWNSVSSAEQGGISAPVVAVVGSGAPVVGVSVVGSAAVVVASGRVVLAAVVSSPALSPQAGARVRARRGPRVRRRRGIGGKGGRGT